MGVLECRGERDGDRSGAGADVGNAEVRVGLGARESEDGFDEVLGLWTGDEDVRCDAEGEAEELLSPGEVLERPIGGAVGDKRAEGIEVRRRHPVVTMGKEPRAVAMEYMGEQGLGVAAGDRGRSFEECVADSHAVERIAVACMRGIIEATRGQIVAHERGC
jgi:hypothetical protein